MSTPSTVSLLEFKVDDHSADRGRPLVAQGSIASSFAVIMLLRSQARIVTASDAHSSPPTEVSVHSDRTWRAGDRRYQLESRCCPDCLVALREVQSARLEERHERSQDLGRGKVDIFDD